MSGIEYHRLQVLIANEQPPRVEELTEILTAFGYDAVVRTLGPDGVADFHGEATPDLALVRLSDDGVNSDAFELVSRIAHEVTCPVIVMMDTLVPGLVTAAAKRGAFACVTQDGQLPSAISIALQRSADYTNLKGAFERRALIERAKGILMERHGVGEREAFELLRRHSQNSGHKLVDLARGITESHQLLPGRLEVQRPAPSEHLGVV